MSQATESPQDERPIRERLREYKAELERIRARKGCNSKRVIDQVLQELEEDS